MAATLMENLWKLFFMLLLLNVVDARLLRRAATSGEEAGNLLQYRPGDILLAGLMRVHRRGNEVCSEIQEDGIQAVETMNMIIDQINDNPDILPGINLGTIMVDTCDVDSHALQRVVLDILPLIWNVTIKSTSTSERPKIPPALIAGVVGSASSAVSIQVANLLQVFKIPQVSYWSTSPDLSNKVRYKYFFRVVPSDTNQASAMIAFAKEQKWNYISVVYEDDFYGVRGFTEIKELAAEKGICIATSQPVPRSPTTEHFQNIVKKLLEKPAKAVVVFTKRNDASDLMLAAQNISGNTDQFIWIGSDGWSRQIPLEGQGENKLKDETVDGSIGFNPKTSHLAEFDEYFANITLADNLGNFRNPWFAEYISKKKGCVIHQNESQVKINKGSTRECEDEESVDPENFEHLAKMESVADSVLSFVYALDQYHREKCGERRYGLCENMTQLTGTNRLATGLYDYLKNLQFEGINGGNVSFDHNQDGPAVYNILNYQANKPVSGLQKWVSAGKYESGKITWNHRLVEKVYEADSVCTKPCEPGNATIISTEICCWHCQPCRSDEYVSQNGTACLKCEIGKKPTAEKTACVSLPITEMSYTSVYGIVCICIGSVGLLLTVVVTGIYIVYRDTAIVKASGKELCFFVLFGILITFLNFLSMIANPTTASCAMSRIMLAIGPTCMYAGLLTKTIRVVIIFQSKTILTTKVKMFMRPWPQIIWTTSLVAIQLVALGIWFGISRPEVSILYPRRDIAFRACVHLVDISILVGLIYPFVLIIICTILATINRNVPTGFNETQYIGFSMYTTCVIWLAFLPIFITNPSDLPQRIMTTSVCLSLSATTVLVCLFGPRCFTILFHPEENTQKSVMSTSVEKSVRQASLPNISTVSQNRSRHSENNNTNNNNNQNKQTGHYTRNGRAGNSAPSTPTKIPLGYDNGALTADALSTRVQRYYSIPDHLDRQIGVLSDTQL